MSRVHVAPSATTNVELEKYGAPPLSVVPSVHSRLQLKPHVDAPPEQVIAEDMIEGGCEGGEGGGGGNGGGTTPEAKSTGSHCGGTVRL
eukprot:scaffold26122_cov52-Phaeocystis_antarctica.AAC.2